MEVISASEFRLNAAEFIRKLQSEKEIGIRRRYLLLARLTLPSEDIGTDTEVISSLREFRERISYYLDELSKGRTFIVQRRGRNVLFVESARETHAKERRARSYQIAFRELSLQQLRKLLEVLEPHLEGLKESGIEMQLC